MQDFLEWLNRDKVTELTSISDILNENSSTRYSVEINFRTQIDEVLKNFAKICLGYASAGLKKADLHVKQVFDDNLPRIMVSQRAWDDGTWCVVVSWNPGQKSFFITKGFYRKDTKTIAKQGDSKKSDSENASEIVQEVKNILHSLRNQPDRHIIKLNKVPLKRGPKQ